MPDPIRPGTRRIPLIPRDALADTERLLVSARDLLLGEGHRPIAIGIDRSGLRRAGHLHLDRGARFARSL